MTPAAVAPLVCKHCGARLRRRSTTLGGRYRHERADTPDTAIFGSGSECAKNEDGHEVAASKQTVEWMGAWGEWRARCTCGWVGSDFVIYEPAEVEADVHARIVHAESVVGSALAAGQSTA